MLSNDEVINDITRIIQQHSEPQSLLDQITKTIGEHLSLDGCFLLSGMTNQAQNYLSCWSRNDNVKVFPQSIKTFFTNLVRKNQSGNWPIIIDGTQDLAFSPLTSWQSLLVNRLIFRGQTNGFILLGDKEPQRWSNEELHEFKQLQDILSLACFMTRPNQPPPTLRQSLLKTWYKETQEQISNRNNLLELQEQIITTLSDRIRNPLATINMAVNLLEGSSKKEEKYHTEKKYWQALRQAYSQIEEMHTNITILRKINTKDLTFNSEEIVLEVFLGKIAEYFQTRWQNNQKRKLQLVLEIQPSSQPISLSSDSQHLEAILRELLTNAENFSDNNSQVHLRLSASDNQVKIYITNQGLMIFPEEINYIFDPFRRGSEPLNRCIPGIGIGLTLVKGLVDYLGGRIEVSSHSLNSNNLYETTFILSFPQ